MSSADKDSVVIHINKCPACGSENNEDYLETRLSTFFFPLPRDVIRKVRQEPFKLGICNECSHIFQREIDPSLLDLIYNEFYAHYNLDTSAEFQEVYRERTLEFLRAMVPKDGEREVLDIGCGEGTYFPFFEEMGYKCYGVEPSEKGHIAKEKNPNAEVSVGAFEECSSTLSHVKYDVVLMNWVLDDLML